VGRLVGLTVGDIEGNRVIIVGAMVGTEVGNLVGVVVGTRVGDEVDLIVGAIVGNPKGTE
jgi:outer membrane lipoprotein SlyB